MDDKQTERQTDMQTYPADLAEFVGSMIKTNRNLRLDLRIIRHKLAAQAELTAHHANVENEILRLRAQVRKMGGIPCG